MKLHQLINPFFALLAGSTLTMAGVAQSLTLVPPGLNPGDQYRLVFVTSTTRNATSSNIEDYNAFVTNTANAVPELAALGTTWKAIGSTLTVDARDNTNTNPTVATGVPIFGLDGVKVADNNSDLWDANIYKMFGSTYGVQTPIFISELGTMYSGFVFTGTSENGQAVGKDPDIMPPLPLEGYLGYQSFILAGYSTLIDSWIFDALGFTPDRTFPFYAMSGILTAPASTPEPSSLFGLLLLGSVMLEASFLYKAKN